jgi:hypothetical protein
MAIAAAVALSIRRSLSDPWLLLEFSLVAPLTVCASTGDAATSGALSAAAVCKNDRRFILAPEENKR